MAKILVGVVFSFLNSIINLILTPIINLLQNFFDIHLLLLNLTDFFNQIFIYIKWFKSFMFNTLCFPIELFYFIGNTLASLIVISALIRVYRFIRNIWRFWRLAR